MRICKFAHQGIWYDLKQADVGTCRKHVHLNEMMIDLDARGNDF